MSWQPAAQTHAIDRVAASINVAGRIGGKAHDQIAALVQARAALAGINELSVIPRAFAIQLAAGPDSLLPQIQPEPGSPGRVMRRTVDGRVAEEVVFDGASLVFNASVYSSWDEFITRLTDVCLPVIEQISLVAYVREVRLEYWNRFEWISDDPPDTAALVNPASKFLPARVVQAEKSWHSHLGYFIYPRDGVRTLVNLNVDVAHREPAVPVALRPGVHGQASIYTLVGDHVLPPVDGFDDAAAVVEVWNRNHAYGKAVLGNTLNPELTSRIALNAPDLDL
jgi:hypothetical protein